MPQFILNTPSRKPKKGLNYYDLSDFAKGYVEAMFFTNGDTGDEENEHKLNELGVERLTKESLRVIQADCDAFLMEAGDLLALAENCDGYSTDRAGNDFWFTRQGHGVGFWDRKELEKDVYRESDGTLALADDSATRWEGAQPIGKLDDLLTKAAKKQGECYVETWRGWIYAR